MSHLDYYTKHGISPVRYRSGTLDEHFQRRESLYRALGIPRLAVRGARVLEVAAGSGQNSLYLASLMPRELTLLEPNPTGVADIRTNYAAAAVPHTAPNLIEQRLENYEAVRSFDIVVCENWLGSSRHERALLRKLGSFVDDGGFLVVTAVAPIGFLPNLVRRALAAKLSCGRELSFEQRTDQLVNAFRGHLDTIASMTRNATDWVHDNMMNPAYFDLCLTVSNVLEEFGDSFQIIGSSPSFSQDWRWFKSLHGDNRRFNAHFLDEYWAECHNFIDYRREVPRRTLAENQALERSALSFLDLVRQYELAVPADAAQRGAAESSLLAALDAFVGALPPELVAARDALEAARGCLGRENLGPEDVRDLREFAGLFGRETLYVSLSRMG